MKSISAYSHPSRAGLIRIHLRGHRWHIEISGEEMGSYATAQKALDDLLGGHCFWPDSGDPSSLGLPDGLSDWEAS